MAEITGGIVLIAAAIIIAVLVYLAEGMRPRGGDVTRVVKGWIIALIIAAVGVLMIWGQT